MSIYRLFLMRHGEASWATDDIFRPLTERGKRQVQVSGKWMNKKKYIPDAIFYSPSTRTRETRLILGAVIAASIDCQDTVLQSLYECSTASIKDTLHSRPLSLNTLLIGHNPGLTDFVNWLCGNDFGIDDNLFDFGTGSLCVLEYTLENQVITFGCGNLVDSIHTW